MKEISIVIPSKDEERTIAKCIESVENALEGVRSYEIILVDSRSTDETISIAKKYSIKILRLRQGWPVSPSAGRYIGTINSHGKYIFYFIGVGQFLRLHFTIENLYEIAKTYHLILWTNLFLLMFLIPFILSILTGNFILPKITSAFALFLCITLIIRHRNIKKSYLFVYGLFSKSVNIVYGFLKKTKKINEYPSEVEIVK